MLLAGRRTKNPHVLPSLQPSSPHDTVRSTLSLRNRLRPQSFHLGPQSFHLGGHLSSLSLGRKQGSQVIDTSRLGGAPSTCTWRKDLEVLEHGFHLPEFTRHTTSRRKFQNV